jgi:hypothetical protein
VKQFAKWSMAHEGKEYEWQSSEKVKTDNLSQYVSAVGPQVPQVHWYLALKTVPSFWEILLQ